VWDTYGGMTSIHWSRRHQFSRLSYNDPRRICRRHSSHRHHSTNRMLDKQTNHADIKMWHDTEYCVFLLCSIAIAFDIRNTRRDTDINNKKLIIRGDRRTLPPERRRRRYNIYHHYTQFPRNVSVSHRRIATFSDHHEFFVIIALYKYSYLLTDHSLVDNYLWQFYGITPPNHVVGKFYYKV